MNIQKESYEERKPKKEGEKNRKAKEKRWGEKDKTWKGWERRSTIKIEDTEEWDDKVIKRIKTNGRRTKKRKKKLLRKRRRRRLLKRRNKFIDYNGL